MTLRLRKDQILWTERRSLQSGYFIDAKMPIKTYLNLR